MQKEVRTPLALSAEQFRVRNSSVKTISGAISKLRSQRFSKTPNFRDILNMTSAARA